MVQLKQLASSSSIARLALSITSFILMLSCHATLRLPGKVASSFVQHVWQKWKQRHLLDAYRPPPPPNSYYWLTGQFTVLEGLIMNSHQMTASSPSHSECDFSWSSVIFFKRRYHGYFKSPLKLCPYIALSVANMPLCDVFFMVVAMKMME